MLKCNGQYPVRRFCYYASAKMSHDEAEAQCNMRSPYQALSTVRNAQELAFIRTFVINSDRDGAWIATYANVTASNHLQTNNASCRVNDTCTTNFMNIFETDEFDGDSYQTSFTNWDVGQPKRLPECDATDGACILCTAMVPPTGFWRLAHCNDKNERHRAVCRRLARNEHRRPERKTIAPPDTEKQSKECPKEWLELKLSNGRTKCIFPGANKGGDQSRNTKMPFLFASFVCQEILGGTLLSIHSAEEERNIAELLRPYLKNITRSYGSYERGF